MFAALPPIFRFAALVMAVCLPAAEVDRSAIFKAAFAMPAAEIAAIAPDGKHVAVVSRISLRSVTGWKSGVDVSIIDLTSATVTAKLGSDLDTWVSVYLPRLRWLDSDRLLVHFGFEKLVVLTADGKHFRWLPVGGNRFSEEPTSDHLRGVRMGAFPPEDPDFVYLLGYSSYGQPGQKREAQIAKFHLTKPDFERVWREKLTGRVILDRQGRARVWHEIRKDAERFHLRDPDGKSGAWRSLDEAGTPGDGLQFALAPENYFDRHTAPLAFDRDPNTLLVASNVGRETVGIYGLDVTTGRRTGVALEHPDFDLSELHTSPVFDDSNLVFDPANGRLAGVRYDGERRSAFWADEDLRGVQAKLEALLPAHGVQIENWDAVREKFLVLLTHRVDAGTYAIYTRSTNEVRGFLPFRPPHPAAPRLHTTPWKFTRADGSTLHGQLTLPLTPAKKPIPVIAYFQTRPWMRVPVGYSPHVTALAMMGYAVVEVNHRGVTGLGASHWLAGRSDPDAVAIQDMFEAIDRVAVQAGLEAETVAVCGARFGGLLALRAAQLVPQRVACVVAIDAETDLTEWEKAPELDAERSGLTHGALLSFFGPTREALGERSPITHAAALRQPTLLAVTSDFYFGQSRALRRKLSTSGQAPVWLDASGSGANAMSQGGALVSIEKFLGEHVHAAKP